MAKGRTTQLQTITELTPKWDMGKAIELRMAGMSYGDIAKFFSIPKPTVQARLKPFFGKEADVPAFKAHRADLFAGQQVRLLSAITDKDIEKASLRDKVIAAGVLYDKERLERGQSTSNVSMLFTISAEAEKLSQSGIIETAASPVSTGSENVID